MIKEKTGDLNGDNKKEHIVFACYRLYNGNYRFILEINRDMIVQRGENIKFNFAIVDIDINDDFKEIAVEEYGPSDDYATYFCSFKDGSTISTGKLPGIYALKIDGSGIIHTRKGGNILHAWFYPARAT